MVPVIQINDQYAFAFGLTWQTLDAMMSRASQIKEIRAAHEAHWLAAFKFHSQENIGYTKSLTLAPKITTLSGAGQVAISTACKGRTVLVLMEELGQDGEENDVAFVALLDGNVVHDAFVKVSAVDSLTKEFSVQCARASIEFVTVGSTITLPRVEERLKWSDFLPKPRSGRMAKFQKPDAVPVVELKNDIPGWVLFSALFLGVVAVGYWQWDSADAEKSRLRRLSLVQKPPTPAQLYTASIDQLLAQPVMPANQVIRELHNQLREMPIELDGWNLKTIDCGLAGCSALWLRGAGTFQEFVDHAPKEWGEIQLNSDGVHLAHNLPIKLTKAVLPVRDKWPTERDFILSVGSKWQRYGDVKFKAELFPAALMGVPASVQPQAAASLPNSVWASKWDVKDSQWWMSEALYSLPSNVSVESVGLSFGPVITFNAQGKVYVRK